jgi:hypothetical protein
MAVLRGEPHVILRVGGALDRQVVLLMQLGRNLPLLGAEVAP